MNYWGEFPGLKRRKHETKADEIILPKQKKQLKAMENFNSMIYNQVFDIHLRCPYITQTVEVMNQTEMLQGLIDTYARKSGSNSYVRNPCQMIPQVDFPPENTMDLKRDDKFAKPIWFLPPISTAFTLGYIRPGRSNPQIDRYTAHSGIRKAIAGILSIAQFSETSKNALNAFANAVEEYIITILQESNNLKAIKGNDKTTVLDVSTLTKVCQDLNKESITSLHNYQKHMVFARNRAEIEEFNELYDEYEKIMKESENLQRENLKEEMYFNLFDFTGGVGDNCQVDINSINIMSLLEGDSTHNSSAFGDILENPMPEEQVNFLRELQNP